MDGQLRDGEGGDEGAVLGEQHLTDLAVPLLPEIRKLPAKAFDDLGMSAGDIRCFGGIVPEVVEFEGSGGVVDGSRHVELLHLLAPGFGLVACGSRLRRRRMRAGPLAAVYQLPLALTNRENEGFFDERLASLSRFA